jgi:hypothetical protein
MPIAIILSKVPSASQVYHPSQVLCTTAAADSCMLRGAANPNPSYEAIVNGHLAAGVLPPVRQALPPTAISYMDPMADFVLNPAWPGVRLRIEAWMEHRDSDSLSESCPGVGCPSTFSVSDRTASCCDLMGDLVLSRPSVRLSGAD